MAEENQGLFYNPQTENVIGQAYNDLLVSQQERIAEEQTAASNVAAMDKAKAASLSDAEEARIKLIKDQMEAAEKAAAARKKEVSAAIKNIDTTPNLLWGSHGYALRSGGDLLSDNMPEYLEQYGVDHMYRKTEEYNKYLSEAQRIFNKTESLGREKLLTYGEELDGSPGFLQGYSEEQHSAETSFLNQKDRFGVDFVNGEWEFTDNTDGSKYNGVDWIKKIEAEANSKFQDVPMRNFDLTVVNAFSNFRLGSRLKVRENMVKHLDDELSKVGSMFYNTAVNELYVNHLKENPEDQESLTFKEFYAMDNNGLNKTLEALDNFKEDWMKMWDDKMAKDQSQSGGRGRGRNWEETIETYGHKGRIHTDASVLDITARSLTGLQLDSSGPSDPRLPESIGLNGVMRLIKPIDMQTGDVGWDAFKDTGVVGDKARIQTAAVDSRGRLSVSFLADFPAEHAPSSEYDDIMRSAGVITEEDAEPGERTMTTTFEVGSGDYFQLVKSIGANEVKGYTPSAARDIAIAMGDINSTDEADFYMGILVLAKYTNTQFYNDVIKQIKENGINVDELSRVIDANQ